MTVKTLKDFADEPCQDVAPDSCEGRKRLKVELREAARGWRAKLFKEIKELHQVGLAKNVIHVTKMEVRLAQITWIDNFFNLGDEGE